MPARPLAFSLLAAACVTAPVSARSLEGLWGAPQATLELTPQGGELQEGCGNIAMGPLRPDAQGRFVTTGRQTVYRAGPQRADETPDSEEVGITGRVQGETLILSIAPKDAPPREIRFEQGLRAKIVRCF